MSLFNKKPRVRFAPSPTGYLHLGGLRTALYNYLYARQTGGVFVLRIEDTDRTRMVDQGTEKLIQTLNTMGLEYDEGPYLEIRNPKSEIRNSESQIPRRYAPGPRSLSDLGAIFEKGSYGPYIQSARLPIYQKYVEQLLKKKKAYYCFCAPERLEELRQEQMAKKQPTMYDKKCLSLSKKELNEKLLEKTPHVARLNVPLAGKSEFIDAVHGQVSFLNKLVDDQVLLKSDGYPTYHLANVVDDHLMKITTVIRGEEWLPSTPKHLLLYKAFGWKPPQFAHLPLLLNQDKSKLSKRQGDVAVEDYLAKGYLKIALLNFIAFLGWNPGTEQEFFTLSELIKSFSFKHINKAGAVFNLEKLDWLNAHYIKQMSTEEFYVAAIPYLTQKFPDAKNKSVTEINNILALEKERVVKLSDVGIETDFFFVTPSNYPAELLIWKTTMKETAKNILEKLNSLLSHWPPESWNKNTLEAELKKWIETEGLKNGDVLWPLRVALSGKQKSPPPFDCLVILGREESLKRIQTAISKL